MERIPSSSYTETNSTTMQRFFNDAEFLLATGRNRDGNPPDRETVEQFVTNRELNQRYTYRKQFLQSLFDLYIWNEPYTETAPSLRTASWPSTRICTGATCRKSAFGNRRE